MVKSMNDFFGTFRRETRRNFCSQTAAKIASGEESLEFSFELKGENSWDFFIDCLGSQRMRVEREKERKRET